MKLNNGYTIPVPGFGTFKTPDGEICVDAVREAIKVGYTHIESINHYRMLSRQCCVSNFSLYFCF